MRRTIAAILVLSTLSLFTGGCATMQSEEHRGAVTGAGVGAVTGGVIGGVIGSQSGSTTEGVLLGALVGGLAGAAIGHYAYDQKRTEEQAQQQYAYNYDKSQVNLVRLESVSAVPKSVKPGEKVELVATYTVLGRQGTTMEVNEVREVRLKGALQGKPAITVQRQGGTYESSVPLVLPADAQKGEYVVETTVTCAGSSDTRESMFTVN